MSKTFHFICGLPRSGSTLLSGILNQNPSCHASMTTSLVSILTPLHFLEGAPHALIPENEVVVELYKRIIDGYYFNVNKKTIFDTNRSWPKFIGILPKILPSAKFIFCVRDIPSILNSFENFYIKRPLAPGIVSGMGTAHVWTRLDEWSKNMIVEHYENAEYIFKSKELSKNCIFIDYNDLISNPHNVLVNLYNFLGIEYFEHNLNNINHSFEDVDVKQMNSGLHTVHPKLGVTDTKWILPDFVAEKFNQRFPCFWRKN